MKYFSMFSGIGGFEYGIERCVGFPQIEEGQIPSEDEEPLSNPRSPNGAWGKQRAVCIGYSEVDKYAKAIYRKHYPEHTDYGDATKIRCEDLPDFQLLVAGFPCQSFSVAGKGRGFCDTRGTLFFEIERVLHEKKPESFLLENVRGLLSNDKGRTFQKILGILSDLGYQLEWAVLNSKDFGVPQNRERVFIVGHLGKRSRRQILPVGGANFKDNRSDEHKAGDSTKTRNLKQVGNVDEKGHNSIWGRVYSPEGVSANLNAHGGGLGAKTGLYAIPVLTPERENKRQNGRRFKTDGEPAFTHTAQDRHGVYDGFRIRRLTPTECERLQGFPDNYTKYGIDSGGHTIKVSDSQRYKCLGNAVTTTVITAIINKFITTQY